MTRLVLLSTLVWALSAHAQRFEARTVAGVTLAVPAGWSVTHTATPVPTIHLEERKGAPDRPSVLLMTVPQKPGLPGVAQLAQQFVQSVMSAGRQPIGQQPLPDGSTLSAWQGPIGGIPARLAVVHKADPGAGVGVIAGFAAPTARYDAMGGPQFLMRVLSGQAGGAQPQRATGAALDVPASHRASNMPTLHHLADALETLSPAQVAQGLRQLNPTEVQTLRIYPAFANLLHLLGCRADQGLRLASSGATCALTAGQWQQTMQLLNNDVRRATSQANHERGSIRIAARCTDGRSDPGTCAAYRNTMNAMIERQHQTMTRVIHNWRPDACTPGEAYCVPVD